MGRSIILSNTESLILVIFDYFFVIFRFGSLFYPQDTERVCVCGVYVHTCARLCVCVPFPLFVSFPDHTLPRS